MAKKKSKSSSSLQSPDPVPSPMDQDDSELLDELLAHLDSRNASEETKAEAATVIQDMDANQTDSQSGHFGLKKVASSSRSRFEARKLRKAAEQASQYTEDEDKDATARLEKEVRDEEKAIQKVCDDLNLVMHDINPDGHCLFAAIADQLALLGLLPPAQAHFRTTRAAASQYIFSHPDDFLPFLPSEVGEDGAGATDAGLLSPRGFERYCVRVRDTAEWGGEPEILALSKAFGVPVHVVQHGVPSIVVHDPNPGHPGGAGDGKVVRISYHRKMYGLGEHYNSLRPKPSMKQQVKDFLRP